MAKKEENKPIEKKRAPVKEVVAEQEAQEITEEETSKVEQKKISDVLPSYAAYVTPSAIAGVKK